MKVHVDMAVHVPCEADAVTNGGDLYVTYAVIASVPAHVSVMGTRPGVLSDGAVTDTV